MRQLVDTSSVDRVIAKTRSRMRLQWALDGAAIGTILGAAFALTLVFALRTELLEPGRAVILLAASPAWIVLCAGISMARKIDDEIVARRVDRASNLSDRLSTAIAFRRALQTAPSSTEEEQTTRDLMIAAMTDGARAASRANVAAAAPFHAPKDLKAALVFVLLAMLIGGLSIPMPDRAAHMYAIDPDHGAPGATVHIIGANLSADTHVRLNGAPLAVDGWAPDAIVVTIPLDAKPGITQLAIEEHGVQISALPFTIVDPKDVRYHDEKSVVLDPDDKAYIESILAELKAVAKRDQAPELDEFAKKIEQLMADAEQGKITKEQLLEALSKAEDALSKGTEPNQQEIQKQMQQMGEKLSQDPTTKDLGAALAKNDLQKAKQELEKLAEKLDNKELSDKQKQDLAKKLDEVAKEMEKQDEQKDKQKQDKMQQDQQQQEKLKDEMRRLDQQKKDEKDPKKQEQLERRLEDKKRELEKLEKDEEQQKKQDESNQKRSLERLEKDMQQAAQNLQKPQKQEGEKDQDQQEREKQASQNLKDAARETGKVDDDQRKQGAQKKVSSQMDDLREAMRQAKQKGNKGPQDPFNKQNRQQDFISRARGGKSKGQGAWKPGQQGEGQGKDGQGKGKGQGEGKGEGENGGDGTDPQESNKWGTGHDDNLAGDPTNKSGNEKDQDLQGKQGARGSSKRETILAAAQKGFASVGYQQVYADYQRIVEEVMRTEKLPSSYKYYVKRYFAKIHPSMTAAPDAIPDAPAPKATP
jgi:hypothetical protein